MIDIVLLIARLLFVVILYVFLFAIVRTGINLAQGTNKKDKSWSLVVERGPKELKGIKIPVRGPVFVGRAPGADIVIADNFVSGRHARFQLMGQNLFIEDLGSRNGTAVNGERIFDPVPLHDKDMVNFGDVSIRIRYE